MQTIGPGEEITGNMTVEDELVVVSSVFGSVQVPQGTSLDVRGTVTGKIAVNSGGSAVIYGKCYGGLSNNGQADVYGTLVGGIRGEGRTRVSTGALVDGVRGRALDWERTPLENEQVWDGQNHQFNIDLDGSVSAVGVPLIEEHIVVEGQLELIACAANGVHVPSGSRLSVIGAIAGGLTVDPGGRAVISGVCMGGIVNNGEVDLQGVLYGGVSGIGRTRISPDSLVDGVKGSDLRGE